MKKFNINNYTIYQNDLKDCLVNLPHIKWDKYTRDQLITKFMPLSENLARKFATSHQAIGILSINDLIQFGHIGLINAVDKLNWDLINESDSPEQTLKSFLSKRIKGTIRRSINHNMGDIKIPEWKINEIRKGSNDPILNNLLRQSKSIYLGDFVSNGDDNSDYELEIPDESTEYNVDFINSYLLSLLSKHLLPKEAEVIRLSYGLDCPKHNAVEICALFNIPGTYKMKGVRISEIKKEALDKLIRKTNDMQPPDSL
jgi:RNA polymerase sigma factor (sigma-70 family)